jgi:hypothetical protein
MRFLASGSLFLFLVFDVASRSHIPSAINFNEAAIVSSSLKLAPNNIKLTLRGGKDHTKSKKKDGNVTNVSDHSGPAVNQTADVGMNMTSALKEVL